MSEETNSNLSVIGSSFLLMPLWPSGLLSIKPFIEDISFQLCNFFYCISHMVDLWNYKCLQPGSLLCFMNLNEPPHRKLKYFHGGGREQGSRISSIVCSLQCAVQALGVVCKQYHLPRLRTGTILGNPNTLLAYWPLDNLLQQQWNLQCAGKAEGQRWEDALLP